ncbi:uncharacterized protein N7479_001225 [Penicillium vulpinum]|uniref:Uncharacterized protein n=1 Tax=Penicillium vulpinum TaxID=29845 RepID=A0A1V6RZB5_9EURO|nr:uncharacterized protein N7479_001225 [Penicillium vulpinum]KAJ5971307.1 hypothetical protein N7479_001225 [Penicillium vulpinum]OQE07127.1 hypothetical protein PENVUL_c015G06721 [Penicillium vulpinum]
MEPTTAKKHARVEDPDDDDDYPPRYRPPPFCQDCGARSHPGTCRPRCYRCDKRHIGICTAFCRKCAEVGHSWRYCRLFIPDHIWRKQRGRRTIIQNVKITVPIVDPAPVVTAATLNTAILAQLDTALGRLHSKAGIPMDSRVVLNNVNITTILAPKPIAPDTPLLERVQRIPTGPRSSIPKNKPAPAKSSVAQSGFPCCTLTQPTNIFAPKTTASIAPDTSLRDRIQRIPTGPRSSIPKWKVAPTKPASAQSAFASSKFPQPIFGQTAFSLPTFIQTNDLSITPTWPHHSQPSPDSKH